MSDKRIPGPSGTLHIDDGGSGGIPVVFLHSFAGSSSHWSSQLMHLRRTRRALALDFRGHGQSDPPADNDYSIEGMTADLSTALDVSGIKKAVLVGHSMGGSVAAAYAGAHADDVAGLVLVETPGKTSKDQARQIMQSIESNYDKVMQDYWDKLLQNAQPQTATQIKAEMGRLSRPVSLKLINAVFEFDPLPALHMYRNPTLAITAQREDMPNDLHRMVPNVTHRRLTGTSHWLHLDRPGDFNLILDDFLETLKVKTGTIQTTDKQMRNLFERMGHTLSSADAKERMGNRGSR